MRKLCESIQFWLRKGVKGEELDLLVVMDLTNLINHLISHKNLKYYLFSSQSKTQDYKKTISFIYALINAITFTHLSFGLIM